MHKFLLSSLISYSFLSTIPSLYSQNVFEKEVGNIIRTHSEFKSLCVNNLKTLDIENHLRAVDLEDLLKIDPYLIKVSIKSNKVEVSDYLSSLSFRAEKIINAIKWLVQRYPIRDCELCISLGDASPLSKHISFAMCKEKSKDNIILIPDYDQLEGNYQVIKDKNVVNYKIPFHAKVNKAVWRGCTAGSLFTEDNYLSNYRVQLCQLSLSYPQVLDAGFTFYAQGAENIPEMQIFKKNWLKYEDEINHKYLIWIDGNVSSYSSSGWRLFSNSCVLKQNSPYMQWYFPLLKEYVHYVPFEHDCSDLIDKLQWCFSHEAQCEKIANDCYKFAQNHITKSHAYAYLYFVLNEYSKMYQKLK